MTAYIIFALTYLYLLVWHLSAEAVLKSQTAQYIVSYSLALPLAFLNFLIGVCLAVGYPFELLKGQANKVHPWLVYIPGVFQYPLNGLIWLIGVPRYWLTKYMNGILNYIIDHERGKLDLRDKTPGSKGSNRSKYNGDGTLKPNHPNNQ